ncbi:MAG: phage holin family protein [Parvibaculum sp.]|uniref:phage holin family protein n=1 Tax=Parvibaculum sp. TaxID=2024848 RepID=UPI003C749AA7
MIDTTVKLRRLAEVELMRAEIEARKVARRILWTGIAVLVGLLALAMLAFALFIALSNAYGQLNAALIVGGGLAVMAAAALAFALQAPGRTAKLESEILARSIDDAREDLREDLEALEKRFAGLSHLLQGPQAGAPGTANPNIAIITLVLNTLSALSPTLRRYIEPILKIIG